MVGKITLVFVLHYIYLVFGETSEPQCFSKFDYDEKMLLKLLRFEEKIQKFESVINDLKAQYELEKVERRTLFDAEMEILKVENAEEIGRQNNLSAEINTVVNDAKSQLNSALQKIQQRQTDEAIAFTVSTPSDGPVSGTLTFNTEITNKGKHFDTGSGKFTCSVSGLYYFSLHIIKKRDSSIDQTGCYLQKNGVNLVRAYIDPQDGGTGADTGSYGVSNSVYIDLDAGDVITLADCYSQGASSMEPWSAFSGFLAKPKS